MVEPPSKTRYKLTLAYDGRPWKGWQSQPGGATIQDQLEAALLRLTGQRRVIYGSGRTDAGVHARGQTAHFDGPDEGGWTCEAWRRALNANLPISIRILDCAEVAADFHARFDTTGKIYEYCIWRGEVMDPFQVGLAWHRHGAMDLGLLREAAASLVGTHNFSRLSANRGLVSEIERRQDEEGVTRTLHRVEVQDEGTLLRIIYEGDGFLYKMVRLITGSLVHAARGRASAAWVRDLIQHPEGTKSNHCAPADGLYLMEVKYPHA